jgi:hypothetical protein
MPLIFGRVLASGIMVPVNVDTDGNVQVDVLAALPAGNNNIGDVDVLTLPSIPSGSNLIGDVQARNLGYISGAWQKDPLRFGYSGQVYERVVNTALAAGVNNLDTSAVPAGRIWVVTSIACHYVGTVAGVVILVVIQQGANLLALYNVTAVVSNQYYDRQGQFILAAGDFVRLTVSGATLNDDARLFVNGYYVDIAL